MIDKKYLHLFPSEKEGLDDQETRKNLGYSIRGDSGTNKALSLGYQSLLLSSKYSRQKPTTGIVLSKKGSLVKPPRVEVVELIKP